RTGGRATLPRRCPGPARRRRRPGRSRMAPGRGRRRGRSPPGRRDSGHVRRWDGELGGGRGHHRLQRLEVLAEDGLLQADLAFDLERRRGELDGAGWVAELDLQVLGCWRATAERGGGGQV